MSEFEYLYGAVMGLMAAAFLEYIGNPDWWLFVIIAVAVFAGKYLGDWLARRFVQDVGRAGDSE